MEISDKRREEDRRRPAARHELLWAIFWLLPIAVQGQSLQDYVQRAIQYSPQSVRAQTGTAIARAAVQRKGHLPDIDISSGYFSLLPLGDIPLGWLYLSAKQSLPWPGVLAKERQVAEMGVRKRYQDLLKTHLQVALQVKELYYDLYAYQAGVQLLNENKQILSTYEEMATHAVEYRHTPVQSVLSIQVEKNTLHGRSYRDFQMFLVLSRAFNRMLNLPPDAPLMIPDSLSVLDIPPKGMENTPNHPELEMWQMEKEAYARQKELAEYLYKRPSFYASLAVGRGIGDPLLNGAPIGRWSLFSAVGVRYPLLDSPHAAQRQWLTLKEEYAQQSRELLRLEQEGEWERYNALLESAIIKVVGAQKNASLIRRSISAVLRTTERTKIDYSALLKLQLQWLHYRLIEIEGTREAYKYSARLDYLAGNL